MNLPFLRIVPICFLLLYLKGFSDAQYTDANGRKYFEIGLAQNSATPQNCLNQKYPNYIYQQSISNAAQLWGNVQLSLSVSIPDQEIVVWVAGASSISGFASGSGGTAVGNQRLIPWALGGGVTMGDSLLEGFTATWYYGFRTYLKQVWAEYCDFKIVFAGHSIGACVSQMLAYVTVRKGYWEKDLVESYGYGAPRCGNQDFAAMFDQTVPTAYRVNYNSDPVVNTASNSCSRTVDPVVGANPACWFHCCTAVKYTSATASGAPCTVDDDPACSPGGIAFFNGGDHTKYFGYTSANSYNPGGSSC